MSKLFYRICILIFILILATTPALAQVSPKGDSDSEPAVIVETSETPIATAQPETTSQPFSIPGNGEVLDDIQDSSKEFYTITTKNNQTFFIVVDKSSTSQNVYMLSKVDENDLAEFIDGGLSTPSSTIEPQPTVIIQQPTVAPTATTVDTEPEATNPETNYVLIAVIALAAFGGLLYFKVYKPKKERLDDDNEGMEYDDSEEENAEA